MEKRVRFLSKTVFVLVLISSIITSSMLYLFLPGKPSGRAAASYSWTQTDWIDGESANTASHTDQYINSNPWTEYAANASSSIDSAESGNIKLNLINGTWNQTDWIDGAVTSDGTVPTNANSHNNENISPGSWAKFSSVVENPAYIDYSGGNLKEDQQPIAPETWTATDDGTTDTGFNKTGNAKNGVVVSGTGSDAKFLFCDYDMSTQSGCAALTGGSWNAGTSKCTYTPPNGSTIGGVYCGIDNFVIPAGTVNITAYNSGTGTGGKLVIYAASATITGTLSATGKGYAASSGTGFGSDTYAQGGGGGGYGGRGGNGANGGAGGVSYGSITSPNELGSGGANTYRSADHSLFGTAGGPGGGLIKLNVSGTLSVAGTITVGGVNGENGSSSRDGAGGGSGGAIYISANNFTGSGSVTAPGGNGGGAASNGWSNGGGGGGGRISINYIASTFSGIKSVFGGTPGSGGITGGAGTIYEKDTDDAANTNGNLTVNNNAVSGAVTTIVDTTNIFDNLTISGAANLSIPSGKTVTTAAGGIFILDTGGTFTTVDTALTVNGTLDIKTGAGTLSVNASTKKLTFDSTGNLIVRTGATLTHDANTTAKTNYIDWTLANVTVEGTGKIDVSGKGYGGVADATGNTCTGCNGGGVSGGYGFRGGGGGHGGVGGAADSGVAGGVSYDSVLAPNELGSGGGAAFSSTGGAGGGLIKIVTTAGGSVTVASGGSIVANGSTGSGNNHGGGAGGTIYISTGTFLGTGAINANGGSGNITYGNGGGGGGRIALYSTNFFGGTKTTTGGAGGNQVGGAGTIYEKDTDGGAGYTNGNLTVTNSGTSGAVTTVPPAYPAGVTSLTFDNLTISGAAILDIPSGKTVTTGVLNLNTSGDFRTAVNTTPTPDIYASSLVVTGSFSLAQDLTVATKILATPTIGRYLAFGSSASLTIPTGRTLTHEANSTTAEGKVNYIDWSLGSVEIQGTVDVSGKGYAGGERYLNGEGSGGGYYSSSGGTISGGGAGYGGSGGDAGATGSQSGVSYGSITNPNDLGSGGAGGGTASCSPGCQGGKGGGFIRLNIPAGNLNNVGSIIASGSNGGAAGAGAGSGGSINITADSIAGAGTITANGGSGNGNGGGGSGGRIYINYTTNNSSFLTNSGITATGGTGYALGGNGSIYDGKTSTTYMGGGYGLAYLNNSNLKFASIGDESEISNNFQFSSTNFQNNDRELEKIQNTGIISALTSYISQALSGVKNIFVFAFGVPTASAATITRDYTSAYFDAGGSSVFTNILWNANTPTGSSVKFQIATSNSTSGPWTFYGPTGTGNYYETSGGYENSINSINDYYTYVKVKAFFFVDDASVAFNNTEGVTLSEFTINYTNTSYPTVQTVISSKYQADLGNSDNYISSIRWSHNSVANTSIKFQIRTASTAVLLGVASWCGPGDATNCEGGGGTETFYTINTGEAINSAQTDGVNDEWFQYKVVFISDGTNTAILEDVSIGYINNYTGYFTSSPYNTEASYTVPASLEWTEDADENTAIKFQMRTAPDNGGGSPDWISANASGWCGLTNCNSAHTADPNLNFATDYYTASVTGLDSNILNSTLRDGYFDQWIQYRVRFESDNKTNIPILNSATVGYERNTAPSVSITSALQGADGKVTINYNLSDADALITDNINVSILTDIGIKLDQVLSNDNTGGTILLADNADGAKIALLPNASEGSPKTIQVENEQITYTGKTSSSITGATRAVNNTKYAGHSSGTTAVWIKGTAVSDDAGALTGITSSPVSKTAVWTIKTDLPGVFTVSAKIRVTANDSQTGNPTGIDDSDAFTLDTNNPAGSLAGNVPVKINIVDSKLELGLSTDIGNSSYMRFSGSNNLPATCDTAALWKDYATSYSFTDINANFGFTPVATNGVYTVFWQFKDANCNMISGSATTPVVPANMQITDISVDVDSKYRNIIWWNVVSNASAYNVWRCELTAANAIDSPNKCESTANYSIYDTITAIAGDTNYCYDEGDNSCADNNVGNLTKTTKYFYKVTAGKNDGVSGYSTKVSAIPDGSVTGEVETDTIDPELTVTPTNIETTETTTAITWTTDENSYSLVKYGTDQNNLNQIAGSVTESVTAHRVDLSGLSVGTLYYYQVLSADNAGNLLESPPLPPTGLYTFATLADETYPSIVGVPSVIEGQTTATISWTTDEASTSQVNYIIAVDNTTDPASGTSTSLQTELVTSHVIIVEELTAGTTYNYQVIFSDASSNSVTYQSASPFDQFNTTVSADVDEPTLDVAPTDTSTTQTTTTITWTTNENSYSIVKYGADQNNLNFTAGSVLIANPSIAHSVNLSGLIAGTTYYYQIFSADAAGNLLKSPANPPVDLYTFVTSSDSVAPALTISPPAVVAGRDSATINWVTDEASTSQVNYIIKVDNNTNPANGTATALQTELVTNHFVIIPSGLTAGKTYNYQIISSDAAGNTLTSPSSAPYSFQFETLLDKADSTEPTIIYDEVTQGPAVLNTHLESEIAVPNLSESSASASFSADESAFFSIVYENSNGLPSSYSKETGSPSLITVGDISTVTMEGLSSSTKYYYKLRARDLFGNIGESDPYYFTTLSDEIAPSAISDLAIKSPSSDNLTYNFVTLKWTAPGDNGSDGTATRYDVRYSTSIINEDNWTVATQVSNEPSPQEAGSTEQMTITGLTAGTYYFAIKTSDEVPNESTISNILTVIVPAKRDTTAPVVTNATITASSVTATSATIAWETGEESSSLVDFYDTSSASAYNRTQGDSEIRTTSHSVILVGLTPQKTYSFQVKSLDSAGNAGTKTGVSFTTISAEVGTQPAITSGPTATKVSAITFAITWTTDEVSDSVVGYGVNGSNPAYPLEKGETAETTNHNVTLSGLAPLIAYNYEVRSRNGDKTITAVGTFETEEGVDNLPPLFSRNPTVTAITSSTATITWSTTESSNSYIYFGETSKTSYDQYSSSQQNSSQSNVLEHSVQLTSLSASTVYYFMARSVDSSDNPVISSEYSFTTTAGETVACPTPSCGGGSSSSVSIDTTAPTISNVVVSEITVSSAKVKWETNEEGDSVVSYGEDNKYGSIAGLHEDNLKAHTVILYKLDGNKLYNYKVSSKDSSGNLAQSENFIFKTLSEDKLTPEEKKIEEEKQKDSAEEIQEKIQELIDHGMDEETIRNIISKATQPPTIDAQGPALTDITNSSVKISWTTDRKSNSVVRFKAKEEGIDPEESLYLKQYGSFTTLDQSHSVILSNLYSGTIYQYQVQSSDILGNTGKSPWQEFTTTVTPSIYDVIISNVNLNSAIVNWKTSVVSSSIVEYGKTIEYNLKQEDKDIVKSAKHLIKLNNLETGTTYHFRVRGFDDKGSALASDDYTFKTFTLPQIEEYSIVELGETAIKLKWKTNVETDAYIKYTDKETNTSKKQGEDSLASIHSFSLKSLVPGKEYILQIQGRDVYGNQTVTPEIKITTLVDKTSPTISQVRTEVAISSGKGDTVQTIISWKTDEPATSKILWEEGITEDAVPRNSNQEDPNYTTNHIVVLTNFKPSTVYRFRTAGSDRSGNESQSQDFTILIPEKKKSVIQIIITNFEDTFSWVKNLGL